MTEHPPTVRRALSIGLVLMMGTLSVVILVPAPPVAANQTLVYKTGLNYPIALAFSSDGRIFFAEKETGSIRIIYRDNRTLLPTPFYTLPNTDNAGERDDLQPDCPHPGEREHGSLIHCDSPAATAERRNEPQWRRDRLRPGREA